MQETDLIAELRTDLARLKEDGGIYFSGAAEIVKIDPYYSHSNEPKYYWNQLTTELQEKGQKLAHSSIIFTGKLAPLTRQSLLVTEADERDLSIAAKTLRASFLLRNYYHWDTEAIHDEGSVLGVQRAGQSDNEPLAPEDGLRIFTEAIQRISDVLELTAASGSSVPSENLASFGVSKIKQDTAFIMMWMDTSHPELDDICDAVKDVFGSFDVRAIRADDIEHEGIITERILSEIAGAEFLFADLTGARPSVYYEVGYAHALNRRVILYRKNGTPLHFDLAGYNCPEYENLRDLKEKLTRRLEQLTNKKPR